jgi:hypothetical protein
MRKIVRFEPDISPINWSVILKKIESPGNRALSARINSIFNLAKETFLKSWKPSGIISDLTIREFESIYKGEGENEQPAPLDAIFRKADNLALYIVTLGGEIARAMGELNRANEIAAAYMLDVIASEITEIIADGIQNHFRDDLVEKKQIYDHSKIVRYSPGYCGWHISAQKKIFDYLKPGEIGIELTGGLFMVPVKSNSGVLVSGPREIHEFKNTYSFCNSCKTHNCRERIKV